MLIIEIALGIVLGVVLLNFLPQIFSIAVWVVVAAVILSLFGLAYYYVRGNSAQWMVVGVLAVGGYLFYRADRKKRIDEEKERK